jgi:hypothetical protein
MRAPVRDGDGSAVCARAGGLVLRARPKPETLNGASPCASASTACGFGAQAFGAASAFNANIGAWNTASVSSMSYVCAFPARWRALWRTRSAGASVRRGPLCAAAPPMRARVRTRAGTCLRGALGVCTAARRGGSVHAFEYIYIYIYMSNTYIYTYVYLCVIRSYIHHPFICICENRSGLCMRAIVCDGDGSVVYAWVGGLVLRARPKTRNPKPCEPLPVGVDRVRLRRAGVLQGVGVQREHRRVDYRVGVEHG